MATSSNIPPRKYEKPVAWLFGEQLIGRLKGALLYTAFGKKLDPRDWMTGEAFPFDDESRTEFWFDYLADAGDGTKAMYSIAYLALSKLWTNLDQQTTELPATESGRKVSTLNDGPATFTFPLPRGEFLFIGGDTAYHAAEYLSLVNRIQHPFNYAYLDLLNRKLISAEEPRRPVFGIPGNHDYYDQLDGFRRQFRKPVRPEGPLPPKASGGAFAQLTLAGFKRVQEASYVALRLPFDWWFWGLDTDSTSDRPGQNLDRRQEYFFRQLSTLDGSFKPPDKLILATCTPSTVFGRLAREDDEKVAKPQKALKISRPFLPEKAAGEPDLKTTGDAKLTKGQSRLDLSGDVHHYARYWGPKAPVAAAPNGDVENRIREHNTAPVPAATSYASIVSGLGGAFHHPSTTYDNEICEQVLYPSETESREAFANRLFKFWNVITGGRVWLAGLVIAFTIYFGATVPQSSRQFLGNLGFLTSLKLAIPESITPTVINSRACESVQPFWLWTTLGLVKDEWQPPANCTVQNPGYFFTQTSAWPLDLVLGQVFIGLSLIAIIATLILSAFTRKIFDEDKSAFEEVSDPDRKLWPIIGGTALLVIIGLFSIKPYRDHITPFGSSLLVLFTIFAAITAIVLSIRYGEYRFKKSFVAAGSGSRWLEVTCWLAAVAVVACGLWFFGKNNLPAFLISDVLFVTVIVLVLIATMLLPFKVAGDLLYTNSKPIQIIGKLLIGTWHLVLQLLVTYILIRNGNYITWAVAAVLLVLTIWPAQVLMKKNSRIGLSLLWLAYGSVMLTLPWITAWGLSLFGKPYAPVFSNTTGWMGLWPAIVAGGVGAIISCLWTGWYFAVCFAFNGHNNEVGGAARIENFKQFIRFRLTREGLTGYVIAVDDVSRIGEVDTNGHVIDGSDLDVKLVDVFHLVPR
jgi:hypothetical protein